MKVVKHTVMYLQHESYCYSMAFHLDEKIIIILNFVWQQLVMWWGEGLAPGIFLKKISLDFQ